MAYRFQYLAVLLQYHAVGIRHHIDCGHFEARLIIPMAYDVGARFEVVYPTVPHYLMSKESVLFNTHGVNHTADAVVVGAASVALGVAENDFRTTGVYFCAAAGALGPVFVPAAHELCHKFVVIVVVSGSRCVAVERAVAFLMIGV